MDELILKDFFDRFDSQKRNEYPRNIPTDLLEITKDELNNLRVKYESYQAGGAERLRIYDKGDILYKRFTKNFYPNNARIAFKIANDKFLTEQFLSMAKIKTTNSRLYKKEQYEEAVKYINDKNVPLVVKPLNLMAGIGVFMNVDKSNFEYAWGECFNIQNKYNLEEQFILVQDQIKGFEVRVIVTEGKLMSATVRVPAFVKGDGNYTIEELIKIKNIERKKHAYLAKSRIKINQTLEKILEHKGKTLKDILAKDEFCILYPQSNMAHGGENYEVTDLIHENVKKQALDSVTAIPGLHTSGVDIIIENFDSTEGTIIEVNKAPAFQLNYYPLIGTPQRPLKYTFKSMILESRVLRGRLSMIDLDEEEFEMLNERFRFLYNKQKQQAQSMALLLEENEMLKQQIRDN